METSVVQNHSRATSLFLSLMHHRKVLGLLLFMTTFFVLPALAQNITVKGRVIDEKNQPVAGASVVVKGTANGTTTNEDGMYQISAPSKGTLVISSVGYPSKEIAIANQTTHNVSLTATSADLEQVIV
ncbi:MAG TPA: carboxypeptidase-like regulatory domain-containing protein, partial [Flavisolibacter sp.]|nr:carboxypeptidase-like regulatory domain-containing protein [Flavisolibacter sp.]